MHLVMYTGFYRVLPTRDFTWEVVSGYLGELIFYLIPTLLCQVYNNTSVSEGGLSKL